MRKNRRSERVESKKIADEESQLDSTISAIPMEIDVLFILMVSSLWLSVSLP